MLTGSGRLSTTGYIEALLRRMDPEHLQKLLPTNADNTESRLKIYNLLYVGILTHESSESSTIDQLSLLATILPTGYSSPKVQQARTQIRNLLIKLAIETRGGISMQALSPPLCNIIMQSITALGPPQPRSINQDMQALHERAWQRLDDPNVQQLRASIRALRIYGETDLGGEATPEGKAAITHANKIMHQVDFILLQQDQTARPHNLAQLNLLLCAASSDSDIKRHRAEWKVQIANIAVYCIPVLGQVLLGYTMWRRRHEAEYRFFGGQTTRQKLLDSIHAMTKSTFRASLPHAAPSVNPH